MTDLGDRTRASFRSEVPDRELQLVREAIAMVAAGSAPRVVLAGIRHAADLLDPARRLAEAAGGRSHAATASGRDGVSTSVGAALRRMTAPRSSTAESRPIAASASSGRTPRTSATRAPARSSRSEAASVPRTATWAGRSLASERSCSAGRSRSTRSSTERLNVFTGPARSSPRTTSPPRPTRPRRSCASSSSPGPARSSLTMPITIGIVDRARDRRHQLPADDRGLPERRRLVHRRRATTSGRCPA